MVGGQGPWSASGGHHTPGGPSRCGGGGSQRLESDGQSTSALGCFPWKWLMRVLKTDTCLVPKTSGSAGRSRHGENGPQGCEVGALGHEDGERL